MYVCSCVSEYILYLRLCAFLYANALYIYAPELYTLWSREPLWIHIGYMGRPMETDVLKRW